MFKEKYSFCLMYMLATYAFIEKVDKIFPTPYNTWFRNKKLDILKEFSEEICLDLEILKTYIDRERENENKINNIFLISKYVISDYPKILNKIIKLYLEEEN
jgi:hypothetical protein